MYFPFGVQCKCKLSREDKSQGTYTGLLGNFIGTAIDNSNDQHWRMQNPARAAMIDELVHLSRKAIKLTLGSYLALTLTSDFLYIY